MGIGRRQAGGPVGQRQLVGRDPPCGLGQQAPLALAQLTEFAPSAVEIDAVGVVLAFTHAVPLSFRQEVVGYAEVSRVLAQMPCRDHRVIRELWVECRRDPLYKGPASKRCSTSRSAGL